MPKPITRRCNVLSLLCVYVQESSVEGFLALFLTRTDAGVILCFCRVGLNIAGFLLSGASDHVVLAGWRCRGGKAGRA